MTARGVGARLPRKEDKRFLLGQGEYVANIRFPGMLEVAFARLKLGGAIAATISSVGSELAASRAASAQSTMSPDDALKALMDGNRRFVERRLASFQEDIDILMQHTAEKQEPFASVLACADSRVPVELVFDQSIGPVFVNRVAGNIARVMKGQSAAIRCSAATSATCSRSRLCIRSTTRSRAVSRGTPSCSSAITP